MRNQDIASRTHYYSMLGTLRRTFSSVSSSFRSTSRITSTTRIGNYSRLFHNVPFHEDLTEVDEDLFNLEGFKHYKEAPDVQALRKKLGLSEKKDSLSSNNEKGTDSDATTKFQHEDFDISSFINACKLHQPVVFVSKLSNPYTNLAIEDYIYNQMPLAVEGNANRLMFYVNSPCVVIGKNQNPWNEVNLPLLNNLRIPLVRRRSGGGTVVHDLGNVNYSFMTTKDNFDRHTFANLVARAVNGIADPEKRIMVTERGDIVTEKDNLKVSGSAYKLSKGKSYHHGTMLLNLNLEVLRQLLRRDVAKVGVVKSQAAIASVRSPVTNLNIPNEEFIEAVTNEFKESYGTVREREETDLSQDLNREVDGFDQTSMLGLDAFVDAYSGRNCTVITIDDTTELPEEVEEVKTHLMKWEWKFGSTTKFTHTFTNSDRSFQVILTVEKKGLVSSVEVVGEDSIKDHFEFLNLVIERGDSVRYSGSEVAGFVTDDAISDWLGESIDGST